jgi:hypothetical protein
MSASAGGWVGVGPISTRTKRTPPSTQRAGPAGYRLEEGALAADRGGVASADKRRRTRTVLARLV